MVFIICINENNHNYSLSLTMSNRNNCVIFTFLVSEHLLLLATPESLLVSVHHLVPCTIPYTKKKKKGEDKLLLVYCLCNRDNESIILKKIIPSQFQPAAPALPSLCLLPVPPGTDSAISF